MASAMALKDQLRRVRASWRSARAPARSAASRSCWAAAAERTESKRAFPSTARSAAAAFGSAAATTGRAIRSCHCPALLTTSARSRSVARSPPVAVRRSDMAFSCCRRPSR